MAVYGGDKRFNQSLLSSAIDFFVFPIFPFDSLDDFCLILFNNDQVVRFL